MEACLVSPDYFRTMGIPLLKGRYFTNQDNRQHLEGKDLSKLNEEEKFIAGLNTIIIDQEFARRHWQDEDPIGKRIRFGRETDARTATVVGVVGRVKMEGLDTDSNRVQGYFPFSQIPQRSMTVIVKSTVEPTLMVESARKQVLAVDPNQPIYSIRTMDEIRDESVAPEKLNLTLLGLFAGIALVLAIVGIYGVMSYSVTQRTHEIGIRMALGARAADVLKMVIGQGMKLTLIGVGIGLVGAFGLTRLMATLLFGVKPTDPLTFGAIALLMASVAFLSCWLPARRATKVDPMVALRYE
jgi:putative ABC transport system permease protein